MTSPSPFSIGYNLAGGAANTVGRLKDESSLDSILEEAMKTEDPRLLQEGIGQLIQQVSPERRQEAVSFLQNKMTNIEKKAALKKQNEAELKAGVTPGLPESIQKAEYENKAAMDLYNQIVGNVPQNTGEPGQSLNQPNQNLGQPNQNIQEDNPLSSLSDAQLKGMLVNKILAPSAKAELDSRYEDRKLKVESDRLSGKERLEIHKNTEKYDNELLEQSKVAKKQKMAINDAYKAIESGNVKPASIANVFKGMGRLGDKVANAFLNEDQAALNASIPYLLEGWKEVFGVRLSDADLKILEDKLPSIGKSPEANKSVLRVMQKYADLTTLRGEIARDIKKANKGYRPLEYADLIEERFEEMTSPVRVINPNTGNAVEIPAYKLSEAIKSGAKLANE